MVAIAAQSSGASEPGNFVLAELPNGESVCYDEVFDCRGEVSERLKELASKASVGEILPWVRIPPSPPVSLSFCLPSSDCAENLEFARPLQGFWRKRSRQ
jgi:hypothetical protein